VEDRVRFARSQAVRRLHAHEQQEQVVEASLDHNEDIHRNAACTCLL
jgi:hypothetical protein